LTRRPFRKNRSGSFDLRLSPAQRELLRAVPAQVRSLVEDHDPTTLRLFPPAYANDPDAEGTYRGLVDDELRSHHLRSLDLLESTIDASTLDRDQMESWLGALNDIRLVLGTNLDVSEEMEGPDEDDPRLPEMLLYDYLTWLQGEVVSQLEA
jgi:Domain of unknown function (DUF2017)